MSRVKTLTDMGDGSVSNHAPRSPDPTKLLNSPISLDFDPLRFEFKDDDFESFATNGTAGDQGEQEVQKNDTDQFDLKDHNEHDLNTQNTLAETHNMSQLSVIESKGSSLLENRDECDSSDDEQKFFISGSGLESDLDLPDSHSNVSKTKHFQKESITKTYPEGWLKVQRTEDIIQCADFENKDVKSLIETETINNTESDDSLVNTILRTTAKTTSIMVEDNYYTQDAENHLLTHNNIDSKEHRVLNLYENCRSVEQNTSVGLYNESCPHEHKIMRLTEDLEFDKNNFKHASDTNDISLMKETENKDYNSYLNNKTDNQHDITEREVEIEDDKNPKEVKLDDDVTPRTVEIEHDVIPKEVELDDNVTSRTLEIEHDVIPRDIELDDDVTQRTVEIEHDVIPRNIELDDDVTPRTVEVEHDGFPKEVEIKYDVVLRDAVIENDVLPDNEKIEYNVISDEAETDCNEMSKYTEIIEQKKLCSDNIQDEKIVKPNNIPNLVHEDRVSKEHDVVHGQHVKSGSPVSDVDRSRIKQETTTKKQTTSSSKSQHIEKVVTHKDSHGEKVTTSKQSEQSTTRHYHEVNGVSENEKMSSLTETQKKNISIVEKEPLKEVKPSVDRAKVTRTFSQSQKDEKEILCRICGQHVYLMDKIKAEKSAFHKSCFRCKECGKTLNVDTYSSHEGQIYCKPHFKQLFQPKAKFEEDAGPKKPRKFEMIIRENVPVELPPDVVRCDTKVEVDLPSVPGLSDIRSRFESPQEEIHYASTADKYSLQRSESVMQRLAKYQSVVSGHENGELSSSSEDEDEDSSVIRESKKKEKVKFDEMSDLKSQWESGKVGKREGRGDDKKEELSKLRQKICLGRSESMRAVYERACKESEASVPSRTESIDLGRDVKAVSIKEKFEKGDMDNELEQEKMEKVRREKEEDLSVFNETGTAAGARTLFKQIDATTSTTSPASSKLPQTDRRRTRQAPFSSQSSVTDADVVKCSDPVYKDDIEIDASQLTQRFKFFENYKSEPKERKRFQITPPRETKKEESPEREIIRDPNVVRSSDAADEVIVTDTAKKMLNKFKQLENQSETDDIPAGPKPVKRITPPREYTRVDDEREPSPELERDPNIIRCSYKTEDDMTWEADRAKCLRAKFEQWQHEIEKENANNEEEYMPEIDTAKNLRAKFEAIREESIKPREKPKPRVRRFVNFGSPMGEECDICGKRLYLMEKMEANGLQFHKKCFRCVHCNCVLRLDNYSTNEGKLYCTSHFKHLFISKQVHEAREETLVENEPEECS